MLPNFFASVYRAVRRTMYINKETDGKTITLVPVGRLDTTSSPELEAELKTVTEEADTLIFNLAQLEYISSAGLRVLLGAQKAMNAKGGTMTIKNVNEIVSEVFNVTGFVDILNIE